MIIQDKHESITKLLHVVQCYQKESATWSIVLDASWSHSSGISCGSNVLANLNIAKQAVYLMET
jgi:hypothetical protein